MILSNSLSSSTFLRFNDPQQQQQLFLNPCSRILQLKKKSRGLGLSVVTRAGGASSGSYIFALVFPLSLLAITIFTSARIADNLDQKFIEEVNYSIPIHPKQFYMNQFILVEESRIFGCSLTKRSEKYKLDDCEDMSSFG